MAVTSEQYVKFEGKNYGYYARATYSISGNTVTVTKIEMKQDSSAHSYSAYYGNSQTATLKVAGTSHSITAKNITQNSTSWFTSKTGTWTGTGTGNLKIEWSCRGRSSSPYTLNFSWTVSNPSYSVSYNANGGTSTPAKQSGGKGLSIKLASAIKKNNTDANVTISVGYDANGGTGAPAASTGTAVNTTPYTFAKWRLNSTSGTAYDAGAAYTITAANVTMYATWTTGTTTRKSNPSITLSGTKPTKASTTVSSYKVSYNANGGTSTPSEQTATKTRSYSFSQWNSNNAGTGTGYNPSTAYTFSSNATLYAKYTSSDSGGSITLPAAISKNNTDSNVTITVSYDANGGTGAPSASTGTAVNTTPYTFNKWADGSTTGTTYSAGASYTPSAATTMYATWTTGTTTRKSNPSITLSNTKPTKASTTVSSYDVSYNANGGTSTPTKQTATKTRAYTFSKWNTNTGGTGTDYNANTAYTFSANTPLYAKYTSSDSGGSITLPAAITKNNTDANITITIKYDANGGTGGPTSDSTGTAVNTTPYTFNKWAAGSASGTQYAAGASFTPSAATTMYATWTTGATTRKSNPSITLSSTNPTKANSTVSSYVVTYNANGGTCGTASQTATKTRAYTFNKWTTGSDGSGTAYNAGTAYTFSSNATIYAQYSSSDSGGSVTTPTPSKANTINTRVVTYDARGGSCPVSSANSTQTITYTQNGWWTAASGGTQVVKADTSYTPSAATTLYAQYTPNPGSYSAVDLPILERKGFIFLGWSTDPNAQTGITGSYVPSQSETVYAIWIEEAKGKIFLKINNEWKNGNTFIKQNGVWKKAKAIYIKENGIWKKSK